MNSGTAAQIREVERVLGNYAAGVRALSTVDLRVGTPSLLGPLFEYGGRRSYVITPRNARVLAFAVGGRMHFSRRVVHPPMRRRPWLLPAVAATRGRVRVEVLGGVRRAGATGNPREAVNGAVQGARLLRDDARQRVPRRSGAMAATIGVYVDGRLVA